MNTKKLSLPSKAFEQVVESIIERDFFPDLTKLQKQLYWLEALDSGDTDRIAHARQYISTSIRKAETLVSATPTPLLNVASNEDKVLRDGDILSAGSKKRNRTIDDDSASLLSWSAELKETNPISRRKIRRKMKRKEEEEEGNDTTLHDEIFNHLDVLDSEDNPTSVIDSITLKSELVDEENITTSATNCDKLLESLPLDAFLSAFESEDSKSFNKNLEKETGERMRRHWWAHAPVNSRRLQIMMAEGSSTRAAPTGNELLKLIGDSDTEQHSTEDTTNGSTSQC